ncbi:RluA family pseudouridine synthase [Ureaplasma diversum]|uniref:RNA pseudouridylate synthase n=1 Tax=Ureaplasma diversum NCTC 246 TaxID=1188241 RepID=A0A084EWM8_9BACT|nr:RluA family pseudouridine synthase [Ureaplasma diversum]KEZ22370.1 RNA pseudouridylate synthase [Ureaplasma diversum NCTC 246]
MLKKVTIQTNDANQRLDRFLCKYFQNLNKASIYKLIRTKDIKVNNKRTEHNYILKVNDVVSVYTHDKFLEKKIDLNFAKAKDELNIIYEDDHILVVHKPIGLVVHDDDKHQFDTLQNRIKKYLAKKDVYKPFNETAFVPSLCHRLDLNTEGLIVAAKSAVALKVIMEMFKNNDVLRFYQCLVYKPLPKQTDTLYHYMHKDLNTNMMIVSDLKTNLNKTAITKYKYLNQFSKYYRYEIELLTGRTHQIRAVLNYMKSPVVGEQRYITKDIDKDERFTEQCLVSYKIKFTNLAKYKTDELMYLNNKEFVLEDIWFLKKN